MIHLLKPHAGETPGLSGISSCRRLLRIATVVFTLATLTLQGCRAQQPWPLWESYTQHFLDPQGRVIDRSGHDRTTSEGQAYAMFFALVDNDKPHFDKLLDWTEANLAAGDLTQRLPAWSWGQTPTGQWQILDANPASDADLWLAYDLLEAGRLWRDPHYEALGHAIAARIAREEIALIPNLGTTILPGPNGFHPDDTTWILNPSYLPLPVLTRLARLEPQQPWSAVVESLPQLVEAGGTHGFAMDWVAATPTGLHAVAAPAEPTAGVHEAQPAGSYDAIRVYLWLGLADPGTPGQRDLLAAAPGMAANLRTALTPPLEVSPQGVVVRAESPAGFSAAVIPYLLAEGMKSQAKAQADRLQATRDPVSGLYGRDAAYYDQNLALFSTAWTQERFRFERDGKLKLRWR